ncbi:isoprenylcysteine carboxyl methyltransferase family protein [Pararhizobium mangrovi]|uniref:Isoprenylcysteine carboxyl methyltransferase n=1 Tax=Pararhizobium mangrovi TaxID=2590452 RepID=A0A506U862_9HYPH|nr:isoprenylcysteine carboxylmethyltransferase family protein [Pararhizobium mangrovi]TPW29291.1 hypothetical protein FJU11_07735 [Pararhizobium mangrovi]
MIAAIVLVLVTAERLGELVLARRNTQALLARGGTEVGRAHYPLIVALHAAWLVGLWWLAPGRPVAVFWLAVFVALQVARIWVLFTLGRRWTTRIIVVPGERLVRSGPYRFIPHPNYAVVVGEIASLPLAFGLGLYALAFSILNACILAVRIRSERRALDEATRPEAHAS